MSHCLSVLTCNLWNTEKWELRRAALQEFLRRFDPDICCFQEIRSSTMAEIDIMLPGHGRVSDNFNGWNNESNIYFRKEIFSELEHGECFLEMPETDRRLFWVKLFDNTARKAITVSTVHLTHQNNMDEQNSGLSYRHEETLKIVKWLHDNKKGCGDFILTGDFNDPLHPGRILGNEGLKDVFLELGLLQPPTFPNYPMTDEINMNESIDRVMFKGELKPVLVSVPEFYFKGQGLSDHHPVVSVFKRT